MSRNPRLKLLAAVAALAALPTLAAAHNYTYVEGGYLNVDTGDDDESGFRLAGSGDVHPNLALIGEYAQVDEADLFSAGALFHTPLNRNFDWTAGATYEHVDTDAVEDGGYGLRTGLRWQTSDARFELAPEVRYVDIEDDATSLRLGALYTLTSALDLQGAVQGGDDDRYELGLRYNIGPRLTAAKTP